MKSPSLDALYRGVVEMGLGELGFDRIGLLLFDKASSMITGTWGTDEEGQICCEADFHRPLSPESTFIWDAIAFYGSTVSHLIIRKRYGLKLQDMVALKTAEHEKTQLHLAESEKPASLGRLVAGVAHEINTPLGYAVLGLSFSQGVLRDLQDLVFSETISRRKLQRRMAEAAEGIHNVSINLERAARLVQRFKQLAKDQHGEVLTNVISSFQHNLRLAKITLTLDVQANLMVSSYPGMISQILGNFLNNTIAHGYPPVDTDGMDSTLRTVEISAYATEDTSWILDYCDHGRGVPADLHERIFEPFFTTARESGGSGLGLSIVHTLIYQRMGGTLQVYEPVSGGLGFRLSFPREHANS